MVQSSSSAGASGHRDRRAAIVRSTEPDHRDLHGLGVPLPKLPRGWTQGELTGLDLARLVTACCMVRSRADPAIRRLQAARAGSRRSARAGTRIATSMSESGRAVPLARLPCTRDVVAVLPGCARANAGRTELLELAPASCPAASRAAWYRSAASRSRRIRAASLIDFAFADPARRRAALRDQVVDDLLRAARDQRPLAERERVVEERVAAPSPRTFRSSRVGSRSRARPRSRRGSPSPSVSNAVRVRAVRELPRRRSGRPRAGRPPPSPSATGRVGARRELLRVREAVVVAVGTVAGTAARRRRPTSSASATPVAVRVRSRARSAPRREAPDRPAARRRPQSAVCGSRPSARSRASLAPSPSASPRRRGAVPRRGSDGAAGHRGAAGPGVIAHTADSHPVRRPVRPGRRSRRAPRSSSATISRMPTYSAAAWPRLTAADGASSAPGTPSSSISQRPPVAHDARGGSRVGRASSVATALVAAQLDARRRPGSPSSAREARTPASGGAAPSQAPARRAPPRRRRRRLTAARGSLRARSAGVNCAHARAPSPAPRSGADTSATRVGRRRDRRSMCRGGLAASLRRSPPTRAPRSPGTAAGQAHVQRRPARGGAGPASTATPDRRRQPPGAHSSCRRRPSRAPRALGGSRPSAG